MAQEVSRRELISGFVVRAPYAYPIYSLDYRQNVDIQLNYLGQFVNLETIGRGGLFRYDNSDLALFSGISSAKRFLQLENADNIRQRQVPSYIYHLNNKIAHNN